MNRIRPLAHFKRLPLAVALSLSLCAGLAAAAPAITSFSGGSSFNTFSSGPNGTTVGWRFSVTAASGVTVTDLGWLDASPATPLGAPHEVGIWSLAGVLLGSATVQASDPLTDGFRYAAVGPLALDGGTSYVIGGLDTAADGDTYLSSVSGLLMDPSIQFNQAAASASETGFAFPGVFANNSGGRFGPNFQFTVNAATVPEPPTLLTALTALAVLGGMRRRGRHAAPGQAAG